MSRKYFACIEYIYFLKPRNIKVEYLHVQFSNICSNYPTLIYSFYFRTLLGFFFHLQASLLQYEPSSFPAPHATS